MNLSQKNNTSTAKIFILFVLLLSVFPLFSHAAATEPSCTLSVTTSTQTTTFDQKESVFVPKGEVVLISWSSTNANKAQNSKGVAKGLEGNTSTLVDTKKSLTYTFFSGTKKVECSVTLIPFLASMDSESLRTKSHTPTLSGESEGSKTLELVVYKEGSKKEFYTAKPKQQKNGDWKAFITKKLPDGDYTVVLLGDKHVLARTLLTNSLHIGKQTTSQTKVDTVFAVETIPLLSGGFAREGTLIPFSYLQVINIGKKPAVLTGFTVTQTGTMPVSAMHSLSSVDDSGAFVSKIEGVSGKSLFKNAKAFIPTKVTLAPGAMHLFTLKTALVENMSAYLGTQLKLQVTGIESNAKTILGTFPIRAVTWTIAN